MGLERPVKGSNMCSQLNSRQLIEESLNTRYTDGIREELGQIHSNFVITDPCLLDHPIVYASQGFLKMSGYSTEEVIGRNVRFLQGPDTDRRTILKIREAIREEIPCQVSILNYKKSGTAFWNLFHLAPVFSEEDGRVIHFVGVQIPISKFSPSSVSNNVSCSRPNNCPTFVENRFFNHNTSSVISFGSCRRELSRNFSVDLGHNGLYNSLAEEDNAGLEEEPTCEAKESDKQKAIAAVTCILFELTQFSKHTGKTVSDKRSNSADIIRVAPISSSLSIALNRIHQSFVLADPHLPDMPIVHASNLFLQLTGYSRDEVLGRNCRFLQGRDTDKAAVAQIRQSIVAEQCFTVRILNYRKDNSSFWNLLHTAPVRNASGKVAFYVGVHLDVTGIDEEEPQDKGLSPHMKQLGAVGAVRVAVRGLHGLTRDKK